MYRKCKIILYSGYFFEIKNADCKSDIKPDNKFFNISDLFDFSLQLVKNGL